MNGQVKGLIVGPNFVIEESEIIGCVHTAKNGEYQPEAANVQLRGGPSAYVQGELARAVFERCKSVLEKRILERESPKRVVIRKSYSIRDEQFGGHRPTIGHEDWRNQVYVGWRTCLPGGGNTDYWLRWTHDYLYYWLHPEKNVWITEPEQIGMPAWPDEVSAYKALQNAPTPPGWAIPIANGEASSSGFPKGPTAPPLEQFADPVTGQPLFRQRRDTAPNRND